MRGQSQKSSNDDVSRAALQEKRAAGHGHCGLICFWTSAELPSASCCIVRHSVRSRSHVVSRLAIRRIYIVFLHKTYYSENDAKKFRKTYQVRAPEIPHFSCWVMSLGKLLPGNWGRGVSLLVHAE